MRNATASRPPGNPTRLALTGDAPTISGSVRRGKPRPNGATLLTLAIASLSLGSCAAGQRVATKRSPAPPALDGAATAPTMARWRPVPIFAPPRKTTGQKLLTPEGLVWLDDSGARWFAPPGQGAVARVAAEIETRPLLGHGYAAALGVLALTTDGTVLAARPLDAPFAVVSRLPAGSDGLSFRAFGKGFAVRTGAGMLRSTDGVSYTAVPGLEGYTLSELLMGEAGRGIGLFLPEQVALTHDAGKSWQPVPATDVAVRALEEESGGGVLLRPGGPRDGFARRIDLATGRLERSVQPATDGPLAIDGAAARAGADRLQGERMPLYSETYLRSEDPLASAPGPITDGDDVLVVAFDDLAFEKRMIGRDLPRPRRRHPPSPYLGKLGEGFRRVWDAKACAPSSVAFCNGVAAIACPDTIEILVGGAPRASIPSVAGVAVGFDAAGTLLSVSPAKSPGDAPMLRIHATDWTPGPAVALTPALPSPEASFRFVGGCHRPALWLTTGTHAARWDGTTFEPSVSLAGAPVVIGVNQDRDLVHRGLELRFSPSGASAPGFFDPHFTSFSEDGRRALAVRESGEMVQSLDAGHTWTAIASPDSANHMPIVCGKSRCQLGAGAFLDGEGPAPARETSTRAPARPGAARGAREDEKGPTALRCTHVPSAFATPNTRDEEVYPALGDTLFQAKVPPRYRDDDTVRTAARWFAGAPNEVTRPMSAPRERSWSVEASVLVGESRQGKIHALALPPATGISALLALDEQTDARRSSPPRPFQPGPGLADADPAGRLLVALEIDPGILLLGYVQGETIADPRTLGVRLRDPLETGVGLSHTPSGERTVWLVVDTDDGQTEIRHHVLRADLSLGPGAPVPGTRTPRDRLLDLPSCAPGATGAVVRTQAQRPISIATADDHYGGWLQRLLRVAPSSACVERTFVTQRPGGLSSHLVVTGNRGLAMSALEAHGMRCEPVALAPFGPR